MSRIYNDKNDGIAGLIIFIVLALALVLAIPFKILPALETKMAPTASIHMTTVPAAPTQTATTASTSITVVVASSLNLRAGPGLEFIIVGWLVEGDLVEIESCQDDWAYLPAFDGWTHGSWLDPNPCEE